MKKITHNYLFFVLLFSPIVLFSQVVEWSSVMGGQREEVGNSICLDPNGNVITTGSFQDICYGSNFALFSQGSNDIYVQKLSSIGAVLWTKQYGSINSDNGHSVITDSLGNIYVAGTFVGTVLFEQGSLSSGVTTGNYFVLKLDPNGTIIWRKAVPASNSQRPKLAIDSADNLFLTGAFTDTRTFGNVSLSAANGRGFVTKLNITDGNIVWTTQFGSGTSLNGTPVPVNVTTSNITTDALGNTYLTGCFAGHGRFGSQTVLIPNSDNNSYIMKLNSAGVILWTKFYTGRTQGTSIVADASNNIYVAGNYFGSALINGTTYVAPLNLYSIFFQKMDSDGNIIWFKNYDIREPNQHEALPQLAIDNLANLFFSCRFGTFSATDAITFENQVFRDLVSTQPNILKPQLLASFDSNGNNLWVNQYEALADNFLFGVYPDKTTNIAVSQNGLYFTSGSSTFNNVQYSGQSGTNIFTAKLTLPYNLNTPLFENNDATVNLFPNPTTGTINLKFNTTYTLVQVAVYNTFGQLINNIKFSNTDYASLDLPIVAGTFFIEIELDGKKSVKKVVKL